MNASGVIVEERQDQLSRSSMSRSSNHTGGSDSLLDSMESVSSDGGEYQDLPIVVDNETGMQSGGDMEQGMDQPN